MTADRLYTEHSIDLLATDDHPGIVERHSDDAVIQGAVEAARAFLASLGQDVEVTPNLLLWGKSIERDWEQYAAALIVYEAWRLDSAVADRRILDVRASAIRLATWVERVKHGASWGPIVKAAQRRAEANRRNLSARNAALKAEAECRWAPWRDTYFALLRRRWSKGDARKEVAAKMSEESGELPDDKTLSKWLP
jgi:hypothetical protein